jgi:benzoate-CoA ligase family protein
MQKLNYDEEARHWKWEIPEYYNIGQDCVDKHAEGVNKNKVALYWENEKGVAEKYTFLEMKNLSNKFGNVLRKLGLKKGDRFLMRLPNIPQFQIVFIGGVKIGAVPIPSSTMFKGHEIAYRINDSSAVAVVTTPEYVKEVEEIRDKCPTLKHVIVVGEPQNEKQASYHELMKDASRNLELEKTKSTDMAFFCYTSGTTGMPKGAVHLHRWVIGNDPGSKYWQAYKDDDIVAHTGQLNWIYPLGNGFLYAWRHGVSTFIYDGRFDPERWLALLEKYQITTLDSVPTAYRMFLTVKDAEKKYDLSALRHCISAGEPLNPEVIHEWKRRFGLEIYDGIGMTEVMVYLSNMPGLEIRPGSCGKPQPGHKCAIVDAEGRVLSPGEEGTLAVSADDPGLFKEYWNKPDKTAECFKNGWFLSGDTLSYDEDGYFWFRGRGDDLIKASGYRISPFEVESTLIEHPAVLEAAAVASPDEMRGNVVKAFIVLKPGYEPSEKLAREIQEFAKEHSAPYKYPRLIEFVKELPKTQSGKIKRKELREKEFAKLKKEG